MTHDQDDKTPGQALPVIVLGAGGHARVLLSLLKLQNREVRCVLDDDSKLHGNHIGQDMISIAGAIDGLEQYSPVSFELVNAIGSAGRPSTRQAIYEKLAAKGYRFATLIHPTAVVAPEASVQPGAQIMAGSIIQPGALIHANCLINTRASIDHDTTIGEHTHVAPGGTICGGVTIGLGCHIGAGATVIQGVVLGSGVIVGAGATVLNNVPDGMRVAGTPARPI